jgi:hypothetical protein
VALDANDLHNLWRDDCVFWFAKFNPPIVANGRVYLATFAQPVLPFETNVVTSETAVTPSGTAVVPGPTAKDGTCVVQDPTSVPYSDSNFMKLPVGFAWIIQYGLK